MGQNKTKNYKNNEVLHSARIYQQGTQGAEYIHTFRKIGYCSDEFSEPELSLVLPIYIHFTPMCVSTVYSVLSRIQ